MTWLNKVNEWFDKWKPSSNGPPNDPSLHLDGIQCMNNHLETACTSVSQVLNTLVENEPDMAADDAAQTVTAFTSVSPVFDTLLENTNTGNVEYDELQEYCTNDLNPPIIQSDLLPSTKSTLTARQQTFRELHTIFSVNGITLKGQNDILRFLRHLDPTVLHSFPRDCRTLRPPMVPHTVRPVEPSKMIYIGIANVLQTHSNVNLFDRSLTEIRLSVNVDGLPVYRNPNSIGFWPILGNVDKFPVFLIGLYERRKKPVCPNNFLFDFVKEVRYLHKNGLTIDGETYRFVLSMMSMDAPALAWVTGIVSFSGYNSCSKCRIEGTSVIVGKNKKGREIRGIRFLDMNAAPRTNDDFRNHYHCSEDLHLPINANILDGDDPDDFPHHYNNYYNDNNGLDDDESEYDELWPTDLHFDEDELRKHHRHPTLLVKIPGFHLVNCIPLDYMHLVLEGVMKWLLNLWSTPGLHGLVKADRLRISERLQAMKCNFTQEFQRQCDNLENLPSWNATQYRSFLLYTGCVAVKGILDDARYHHFLILVMCMRILCCCLDDNSRRANLVTARANITRQWLRYFVQESISLYGENFAVYNVHNLIHIPDDYERFGPLDGYSAFRFESFLGRLKSLVKVTINQLLRC